MNSEDRAELAVRMGVGIEAQKLLDNELLSSLIYSKKNAACTAFMSTNHSDDKRRKELWHDAQSVIAFELELQQLVDAGNMAQNLLEEADQFKQPNYNPIKRFDK